MTGTALYTVKEIYYTLQGEGAQTGRPSVFCRFTGCNLWTGHEKDRAQAVCQFCDTDFVGTDGEHGGRYPTPDELAKQIEALWPDVASKGRPYVVMTGGEPLFQLDTSLLDALHVRGFEVGVETNGTVEAPEGIDWLCVSPKAGTNLEVTSGDELKLVYPQPNALPDRFVALDFSQFFLQPMDGPNAAANRNLTLQYCLENPQWRLSLQTHKDLGID